MGACDTVVALDEDEIILRGLERAEAFLARDFAHNRVASAYLIAGIEGIGKAQLAFRAAAALLCPHVPSEPSFDLFGDPVHDTLADANRLTWDANSLAYERMKQRTHSDFLWITPPYDEKKKQFKREINVEQIRTLGTFLTLTSGEGAWKTIIIDAADAMNPSAMNALLKWLEEPPPYTVFFLISHREGALLPTIHSRCRRVLCTPPSLSMFAEIMQMPEDEAHDLYRLSGGSIGRAKQWQLMQWHDYVTAWREVARTADDHKIHALVDKLAKDPECSLHHVISLWALIAYERGASYHALLTEHYEHLTQLVQDATIFHLDKRHMIQYIARFSRFVL
ncbi:MAG: hypothetical protein EAZ74_00885 [Alphaproteobacteria bacterium]|nr:MAG: hypothetical protein EAY76_07120 [Alphaproteobacteria bacterium]TAF15759.1 MAG: hypothetical protein EAZ74_00885 [Alphaproteobacteria bacterium]TAF40292.1 MAG: hypothetical protein EAZ66_03350 [Alphaproteobacteria bacterium]TAF75279.1 MAG: hypothetical protein EAZ52_06950 [Alphaproteobacteria bacterium]